MFSPDWFKHGLWLAVLALVGTSCYPGELTVSEADLVTVNHDADYFANNNPSTYFMPDTVGILDDEADEEQLTREEMDFILDQIDRNFDDLGYDRVDEIDEDNLPDVVILVNALITDYRGAGGCIPWWPGWGWDPWWPGWGWGPGYCYPSYVYAYTTGTLSMDMINPDDSTPEELDRVWHAGLNGILRSSVSGNEAFVRDGIDKAFELSPYLSAD